MDNKQYAIELIHFYRQSKKQWREQKPVYRNYTINNDPELNYNYVMGVWQDHYNDLTKIIDNIGKWYSEGVEFIQLPI